MEIFYIFGAALVLLYIFRWDKLRNNEKISKAIDSLKSTCFLALPRKTWKYLKPLLRFICQNKAIEKTLNDAQRPVLLFITTIASVGILFSHFYKNIIEDFSQFLAMLISAFPLFLIWMWKNYDNQKEQEYTKLDLNIKEFDGNWKNFLKFQDIILKSKYDEKKVTAVYALSNYYDKSGEFPRQIHIFFKNHLDIYHSQNSNPTEFPRYIHAIYDILQKNKYLIEKKGLSLKGFKFPSKKD